MPWGDGELLPFLQLSRLCSEELDHYLQSICQVVFVRSKVKLGSTWMTTCPLWSPASNAFIKAFSNVFHLGSNKATRHMKHYFPAKKVGWSPNLIAPMCSPNIRIQHDSKAVREDYKTWTQIRNGSKGGKNTRTLLLALVRRILVSLQYTSHCYL